MSSRFLEQMQRRFWLGASGVVGFESTAVSAVEASLL